MKYYRTVCKTFRVKVTKQIDVHESIQLKSSSDSGRSFFFWVFAIFESNRMLIFKKT